MHNYADWSHSYCILVDKQAGQVGLSRNYMHLTSILIFALSDHIMATQK
ncbi:hypothetical protein yinte0001_20110 [Yersinia intermedia ATCC 29909]|nr:hypothetical protein yinte0001_20110 [Yersinia intermedia ATCC 29909]